MALLKDDCLTVTNCPLFGICDDVENSPAYIDQENAEKWIATVINGEKECLNFYAIDHCAVFYREENKKISTCDAALQRGDNLMFIELKNRKGRGWLSKASAQLKSTLDLYKAHQSNQTENIVCYAANLMRPSAPSSSIGARKAFKEETGFTLKVSTEIRV